MLRFSLLVPFLFLAAPAFAQDGLPLPEEDAAVRPATAPPPAVMVTVPVAPPALPATTVPAPEVPEVDANGFQTGDPASALDLIEKAVTTRNYFLGAAGVLMLLMVVVRRRWKEIPPDLVPMVSLVMTSVPALVLLLMRPGVNVSMVLKQVIIIWLMTSGAWEAIGKRAFTVWGPRLRAALAPAPQVVPVVPAVTTAVVPVQPVVPGPLVVVPPPTDPKT